MGIFINTHTKLTSPLNHFTGNKMSYKSIFAACLILWVMLFQNAKCDLLFGNLESEDDDTPLDFDLLPDYIKEEIELEELKELNDAVQRSNRLMKEKEQRRNH